MTDAITTTTSGRLQKAIDMLKDIGILAPEPVDEPIVKIIEKVRDVDPDDALLIARTMSYRRTFSDLVSQKVSSVDFGTRFEEITKAFDGVREDATHMVQQAQDGHESIAERIGHTFMKLTRGDIDDRFKSIHTLFKSVIEDAERQLSAEEAILDAYGTYRLSIKDSQIAALELKRRMGVVRDTAVALMSSTLASVTSFPADGDVGERAKLELARDEAKEDGDAQGNRLDIANNLANDISVAYDVMDATMIRLKQLHDVKTKTYQRAVSFFATIGDVLAALSATYTVALGLNEMAKSLGAMEEGTSKALESIAGLSTQVQSAGLKAAYGPTVRASSVKMLLDAELKFATDNAAQVAELRRLDDENVEAIRVDTENTRRSLAELSRKAA